MFHDHMTCIVITRADWIPTQTETKRDLDSKGYAKMRREYCPCITARSLALSIDRPSESQEPSLHGPPRRQKDYVRRFHTLSGTAFLIYRRTQYSQYRNIRRDQSQDFYIYKTGWYMVTAKERRRLYRFLVSVRARFDRPTQ